MEQSFAILSSPHVLLLLLLLLLPLFLKAVLKSCIRNPKCPPGPLPLPLIGSLHRLIGRFPSHALCDLTREHGPLMLIRLGEVDFVIASSREAAEQILKIMDPIFASRALIAAGDILLYGGSDILFSPSGPYWTHLRRLCHKELLSTKRISDFFPIRQIEILKTMRQIGEEGAAGPVNLSRRILELINTIVSRTAFGKRDAQQHRFIPVAKAVVGLLGGLMVADFFPSLKFLDVATGDRFKMRKLHRLMDDIISEIIAEHEVKAARGRRADEAEDLVDVLLALKDDADQELPLTMENIKAVISDMYIAGTVTTWAIIDWAMAQLMKDPEKMAIAQKEVRKIVNSKNRLEENHLSELRYLKAIIKEIMRLYPLVPLLPRQCTATCQVLGYEIKAGTRVLVNCRAMCHDPQYWVDPEQFKPERFLGSDAIAADFNGGSGHFEYVPFGAGLRLCPGFRFGMATAELVLAHLLLYFDWKLPYGMTTKEVDMSETYGLAAARKTELELLATPYVALPDAA